MGFLDKKAQELNRLINSSINVLFKSPRNGIKECVSKLQDFLSDDKKWVIRAITSINSFSETHFHTIMQIPEAASNREDWEISCDLSLALFNTLFDYAKRNLQTNELSYLFSTSSNKGLSILSTAIMHCDSFTIARVLNVCITTLTPVHQRFLLTTKTGYNFTLLQSMIKNGNIQNCNHLIGWIKKALSLSSQTTLLTNSTNDQYTALSHALATSRIEIIYPIFKWMLEILSPTQIRRIFEIKTLKGFFSILNCATKTGNPIVNQVIIEFVKRLFNTKEIKNLLKHRTSDSYSPFHHAISTNNVEIVKQIQAFMNSYLTQDELLEIYCIVTQGSFTILQSALRGGDSRVILPVIDCVSQLPSFNIRIMLKNITHGNYCVLQHSMFCPDTAVFNKIKEMMEKHLTEEEQIAQLLNVSHENFTVIHDAFRNKNIEIIKQTVAWFRKLLPVNQQRKLLKIVSYGEYTVFHDALKAEDLEILDLACSWFKEIFRHDQLRILLRFRCMKANILHIASLTGDPEIFLYLLDFCKEIFEESFEENITEMANEKTISNILPHSKTNKDIEEYLAFYRKSPPTPLSNKELSDEKSINSDVSHTKKEPVDPLARFRKNVDAYKVNKKAMMGTEPDKGELKSNKPNTLELKNLESENSKPETKNESPNATFQEKSNDIKKDESEGTSEEKPEADLSQKFLELLNFKPFNLNDSKLMNSANAELHKKPPEHLKESQDARRASSYTSQNTQQSQSASSAKTPISYAQKLQGGQPSLVSTPLGLTPNAQPMDKKSPKNSAQNTRSIIFTMAHADSKPLLANTKSYLYDRFKLQSYPATERSRNANNHFNEKL